MARDRGPIKIVKLFAATRSFLPVLAILIYLHANTSANKENVGPITIGTRWCGNGSIAKDISDLGPAWQTDTCCRAHDLCEYNVPQKTYKYGLYNDDEYTRSDCQCDSEFRECLKNVSGLESISAVAVGRIYFSLLTPLCLMRSYRVPCPRRYYDKYNNSYKHDNRGRHFCAEWYKNVGY